MQLFSNSAAALGAEVGPDGQMVHPPSKGPAAWKRRLALTAQRRQLSATGQEAAQQAQQ